MCKTFEIENIPALLLGEKSDKVFLFIHGKCGNKEEARAFAEIVCPLGWQVLSIDLPSHGERKSEADKFYPWIAVPELEKVAAYIKQNWQHLKIRANSIGAWFSMLAFSDESVEKALFVSPMVDMEKLILDMMMFAGVSEEQLKLCGIIKTTFGEELSYKYLCYARKNKIRWDKKTSVLYAGQDNLVSRETIDKFAKEHNADLFVMEKGEHWFHTEEQLKVLKNWEKANV